MADYYEVESKRDGSYTVTPRNNSGCLSVIGVIVLIIVLAIIVNCCDGQSATGGDHASQQSVGATETSDALNNVYPQEIYLFDMPVARIKQDDVKILSFSKYSNTDLNGFTHQNCYMLLCERNDYCIGYNLDGEYRKLEGMLYALNEGTECWIEFYDGDRLIESTAHLSESRVSCSVNIDVSDVQLLNIYLCSDGESGWLITEDFIVSK